MARVKAEKERARKALEMEARREQGAVSCNPIKTPAHKNMISKLATFDMFGSLAPQVL